MDFFPIFLDLRGRAVLVLGQGPAARRKAELAGRAGARVRNATAFSPALLDGCALAIGAEAPDAELAALAGAARARGVPVNVVDRPELCTAIMPAVVDRAPLAIAVSSGGSAPVLARLVRARIEAMFSPALGRLAVLAARLREETVRRLPETGARRRMLERAFSGAVAELVFAGDEAGAEAAYRRLLDDAAPDARGIVFFVSGGAAADLLTLRALRVLGEADVVLHDRDVGRDLLDLARRDAARMEAGSEDAARLTALARAGQKVVRVTLHARSAARERRALEDAGIACVVVPGAADPSRARR
jgi:uroporphyrin-III C-methyltransferase / precorrin-2 dehydrogenase / sirohydrochlorin ferrochelatase